jgi:hypothetical protein
MFTSHIDKKILLTFLFLTTIQYVLDQDYEKIRLIRSLKKFIFRYQDLVEIYSVSAEKMSNIFLPHTLIKKYPWHFSWLLYLYTFSLYENASLILKVNIGATCSQGIVSPSMIYCFFSICLSVHDILFFVHLSIRPWYTVSDYPFVRLSLRQWYTVFCPFDYPSR